jgi:hypothetical protein
MSRLPIIWPNKALAKAGPRQQIAPHKARAHPHTKIDISEVT